MNLKAVPVGESELKFKALIYGPPGAGKTQWWAENVPNPVCLDFERSTDTLKKIGMDDIPVIHAHDIKTTSQVKDFCFDIEKSSYKTIVFDTISTSQIFQLQDHMNRTKGADNEKRLLPLFQDFRISTQTFNEIFFFLQHANVHVVLIAHERQFFTGEGDMKKLVSIGPSITPALQESTRQLINAVLYFQTKRSGLGASEKITRSMLCNTKGLYLAKNRYGIEETEIVNPTWATFMEDSV